MIKIRKYKKNQMRLPYGRSFMIQFAACQRYGRQCQYWGLCTGTGTGTAEEEDYAFERPHVELEVVL